MLKFSSIIRNSAELKELPWNYATELYTSLDSADVEHNFDDYFFNYWEGIELYKYTQSQKDEPQFRTNTDTISVEEMQSDKGAKFTAHIGAKNPWSRKEPYNIAIYDDILDLKDESGNFIQLKDDEYYFETISINPSKIRPLNGSANYPWEVHIREAGSKEYKFFKDNTVDIGRPIVLPEKTVGIKFLIKNVDQAMDLGSNDAELLTTVGRVKLTPERAQNVLTSKDNPQKNENAAYLRNLTFLEFTEPDGKVIPFGLTKDNYKGLSGGRVAERDLNTYGRYLFRSYADYHVLGSKHGEYVYKWLLDRDAKNGKRLAKIFTTESNDTMILYTAPSGNPVTPNPDPKDPVVPSPDPNNPVTPSPVPEYPGQTEPVDKLPKQPQAVIPVPTRSFNPVFISKTPSPNEPKASLVSTPAASRARYETPQKQAQQLPLLPRTGIDSTTPLSLALLGLALSLVALRFFILRKR